jgi:Recombination, repair and ssDNA binding protein UvsY
MKPLDDVSGLHTYEELCSMASVDIVIKKSEIDSESERTAKLHDKYIRLYLDELHELRRMERGMKLLLKKKTEYYLGKADPEVYKEKPFDLRVKPIKTDLKLYLDADPDMQAAQEIVDLQQRKVDYLKEKLGQINQRGFQINAINEWNKFSHGIS